MAIAYFDCFAGAGGDMIVAALIAAGADVDAVAAQIARLGVDGLSVGAERVRRRGLAGTHFQVTVPHGEHAHAHRPLSEILAMIDRAGLPPRAAERAARIFRRLGLAEAKLHGVELEAVEFHEVGAADSIADIVGACVALELLDVERVLCSEIAVGGGAIRCAHGELPAPAPATLELLRGVPVRSVGAVGEVTTPTAAAVLTTLAESFGPMPAMRVSAVGYGAGTRDTEGMPNLLRVVLGDGGADDEADADAVVELSANVDDCTGQVLGATIDKLLAAGCLDAWAAPIVMKKSRPAWMLSALCEPHAAGRVERLMLAETTTFGVRRRRCDRAKLRRRHETVDTAYGPVRVKVGLRGQRIMTASPEFADCADAAEAHGVPIKEVLAAAQLAWRDKQRREAQG